MPTESRIWIGLKPFATPILVQSNLTLLQNYRATFIWNLLNESVWITAPHRKLCFSELIQPFFFFLLAYWYTHTDTCTHPLQIHLVERSQVKGARSNVKELIKQCRAWNSSTSLCYSIHNTWPTIKDHHSRERKTWFGTLVIPGRKSSNLYFRSSLVKAKTPLLSRMSFLRFLFVYLFDF